MATANIDRIAYDVEFDARFGIELSKQEEKAATKGIRNYVQERIRSYTQEEFLDAVRESRGSA